MTKMIARGFCQGVFVDHMEFGGIVFGFFVTIGDEIRAIFIALKWIKILTRS